MLSASGEISLIQAKKEIDKARCGGQSAKTLASEKGITKKTGLAIARGIEDGVKGLLGGGRLLRSDWMALGSGLYQLCTTVQGSGWEDRHEDN